MNASQRGTAELSMNVSQWGTAELSMNATIVVKSPWDTRHKSLTQLPVVSYCYQIIVLLTHSSLSPQINVELNMYEVFSPTATLSRGEGMDCIFTGDCIFTWNLIIKWDSVPTILSRILINEAQRSCLWTLVNEAQRSCLRTLVNEAQRSCLWTLVNEAQRSWLAFIDNKGKLSNYFRARVV